VTRPLLTPEDRRLTVRERILLFCVASGTDWQHAGVTPEVIITMTVRDMIDRDMAGRLTLTEQGRAALRRLLPGL
jgi:hypothetical protein